MNMSGMHKLCNDYVIKCINGYVIKCINYAQLVMHTMTILIQSKNAPKEIKTAIDKEEANKFCIKTDQAIIHSQKDIDKRHFIVEQVSIGHRTTTTNHCPFKTISADKECS